MENLSKSDSRLLPGFGPGQGIVSGQAVRFPLVVQVGFDEDLVTRTIGDEDFVLAVKNWEGSSHADFAQFLESLREHGRFGLARQDTLATFSVEAIRDYRYDMVARGWSRATCRRRLIQLNRSGLWLVRRGHLKENPLGQIEVPRRGKALPKVLSWSVAEQVVAGESRVRNRAILAVLVYAGLRRGEVIRLDVGSLLRETDVALRIGNIKATALPCGGLQGAPRIPASPWLSAGHRAILIALPEEGALATGSSSKGRVSGADGGPGGRRNR